MVPISSLIDINFMLINRGVVLLVTLLFFVTMYLLKLFRSQAVPSRITTPIALSLFGLILLYFETTLSGLPSYRALTESVQTVIVLLCLAKLLIYAIVDIYLRIHLRREAPSFLRDTVMLVVYLAVGIISLRLVLKIDLSAIAVTTTVITATVAFALQNTLANALSGFSIQSDRMLSTRNWVSIKEKNLFGEIVNVGFRYTTLRTPESNLVLVPNSIIMQNVVVVHGNKDCADKPAILMDVMLGYELPPEQAKALLLQSVLDVEEVLATPEPQVRLVALNDSSITYQIKFWIADPGCRAPVKDLIYTRIWYSVNREGFSFPFPHRQIVQGEAPEPYRFSRDRVIEDLQGMELFAMLDEADIHTLADRAPALVFGPGEVVVRQGESGSSLFVVVKGELEVIADDECVGRIAHNSFFGEMSLLTGAPRSATVRAVGEVWLVEVTKELMEPVLRLHPAIMETLSTILAERERSTRDSVGGSSAPAGGTKLQELYLSRLKQFFGL